LCLLEYLVGWMIFPEWWECQCLLCFMTAIVAFRDISHVLFMTTRRVACSGVVYLGGIVNMSLPRFQDHRGEGNVSR
jgi:hypothetical protein